MSAEGGTRAVVAALIANCFIAVTKLGAWVLTGASSILAEAIHSFAENTGKNCGACIRRRPRRCPKRRPREQHPFGYGRERYIFGSIVSVVLFSISAFFALYEAYHKWREIREGPPKRAAGEQVVVGSSRWCLAAIVAEPPSDCPSGSPRCRGKQTWSKYIRAKAPELPVILKLEFSPRWWAWPSPCLVSA